MAERTTWIKLNRKILDWRWYKDANTFRVFLHLLINANTKEADFKYDTIHRGEIVVSIGNLGEELGLTYDQTRTALKHLKDTNEITIKRRPKYLVISIVNYSKYQDNPNQIPNESQTSPNQIPIKSQQYKNIRIKEKKNNNTDDELKDYGGLCLSDEQWESVERVVGPSVMTEYVDKVADWLANHPRQRATHINVLKKFLKNDGYEVG